MKLKRIIKIKAFILTAILLTVSVIVAHALPLSTYAPSSVLSDGRWVKVSVKESGIHFLSRSELQRMGFSDISRVNVYGYGAMRLPDRLDNTYIDDLPKLQSVVTDRGIYFYATGPVSYTDLSGSRIRHANNPFTDLGYYYLSDFETESREIMSAGSPSAASPAASFTEVVFHERDLVSIGETGHYLVGEDFRYTTSQTFNLSIPDKVEGTKAWLECSFVANSIQSSRLAFTVNGSALSPVSADNISENRDQEYTHGKEVFPAREIDVDGEKLAVGINFYPSGTIKMARLNYLLVNYSRHLRLRDGKLQFSLSGTQARLQGAAASTHVWDVTDPCDIKAMNVGVDGDAVVWTNSYSGRRRYCAWNENAAYPSPVFVENVSNQNLHAEEVPDMVIFTLSPWVSQAQRVADLHRNSVDSLRVLVVEQSAVFNEFSSGAPDANAFRKMLKMFWDRSQSGDTEHALRYALFMGRGSYDNRRLTADIKALRYPMMPIWESDRGLTDNDSFTTDDIFAFLNDNSGSSLSSDYMCIAVGRMPVVSLEDARNVVDKLISYCQPSTPSGSRNWRNRVLIVADDEDGGKHMKQAETASANMMASTGGGRMVYDKIYIDAYQRINGTYPGARDDMFRILDEGVVWWNYSGHANTTSWTHDGLMTYSDINSLYLRHYPLVFAATCDFQRWDSKDISAAEILYRSTGGGVIASISATRPVLITENGTMSAAMGTYAFALGDDGRYLPIGEILRRAKNNYGGSTGSSANSNKLRYVLMGDPAMRLATPSGVVAIEDINGTDLSSDETVTVMARQDVTMRGSVLDEAGNVMTGFNGTVYSTLFDAEYSTTSHGYGTSGEEVTFEQQGSRLFAGVDSVRNGQFEIKISMPSEIAGNFRPAAISMHALSDDRSEAVGVNRDFYVYGYDEGAPVDTIPPSIDSFYLNHSSFVSGEVVNESPVVIAEVSDNRAINMSTAGVGHQMVLFLDDKSLTDVHLYYTPASDGSSAGTIVYPLEGLADGSHSLRLRVWDTSGNSVNSTIEFFVQQGKQPRLFDLYADANPASVETNFYLTHDRPESMIEVVLTVYDLAGRPVWSTAVSGRSDLLKSFPINWKLTDNAGRRVPRGIYLYRASITTPAGEASETVTRRIAVTSPR